MKALFLLAIGDSPVGSRPPIAHTIIVMPTEVGIQAAFRMTMVRLGWIPACAGMTLEMVTR
jgi:hypothetical protein